MILRAHGSDLRVESLMTSIRTLLQLKCNKYVLNRENYGGCGYLCLAKKNHKEHVSECPDPEVTLFLTEGSNSCLPPAQSANSKAELWGHFAARCTTEPPQKMWIFCFGSQIALQLVSLFYFSLIWQIWTFVLLVSSYFMDLWVLGTKGCNVLPSTVEICFKSLAVSAAGLGVKRPWCTCRSSPAAGTGEQFVVDLQSLLSPVSLNCR